MLTTEEIAKAGVIYTPTTKPETTTARRVEFSKSGAYGEIKYRRRLSDGGWGALMWCGYGSWRAWLSSHKVTSSDATPDPLKELLKRVRGKLLQSSDERLAEELVPEIDEALKCL